MNEEEQRFENFLREFEPRRPRSLERPAISHRVWPRRLAAAAVLAFACGTSIWFGLHGSGSSQKVRKSSASQTWLSSESVKTRVPSAFTLTRLALEDPKKVDALLAQSPGAKFPRFDRPDSALSALAKE